METVHVKHGAGIPCLVIKRFQPGLNGKNVVQKWNEGVYSPHE